MADARLIIEEGKARSRANNQTTKNTSSLDAVRHLTSANLVRDPESGVLCIKELGLPGDAK